MTNAAEQEGAPLRTTTTTQQHGYRIREEPTGGLQSGVSCGSKMTKVRSFFINLCFLSFALCTPTTRREPAQKKIVHMHHVTKKKKKRLTAPEVEGLPSLRACPDVVCNVVRLLQSHLCLLRWVASLNEVESEPHERANQPHNKSVGDVGVVSTTACVAAAAADNQA